MKAFTDSHEWIELENEIATVGITSFAQKELGEIVSLCLPQIGTILKRGEEAAILESTKAAADIYAPLSGMVIATNPDATGQINNSPESRGWLFQIKLSNPSELEELMSASDYLSMLS